MTSLANPVAEADGADEDLPHRLRAPSTQLDTRPSLPRPPGDYEKYAYLGPQHRWLMLVQFAAFLGVAVSFVFFATESYLTLPLLAPLSLFTVTSLISLRSGTRRRKVASSREHMARIAAWRPPRHPSVDVFLPSAGEELALLANTYRYVAELSWPGDLTVYVLDDSARLEVRELAIRHGFNYLSRPDRGRLKKAGNLRYGYEHSQGDFIAIFDADFVPRADYLRELIPYFDEPSVGIVQSPQYFDTTTTMPWIERTAGATQELFYRFVQPSRDNVDAAICVGTCAIYRRAALALSGGFAQIGHSEDVHTGVNLMKVGRHVRYVPVVLSTGLCPQKIDAFVTQQYRWCTGSMSLLADTRFHTASTINVRQRLCFWSGFLYYIGTAVNAFVSPLPLLAMVWLFPYLVKPTNSLPLVGAVLLWFIVLPVVSFTRWRPEVLRIQTIYSFCHAVAIWDLMRAKAAEWVPTNTTRATPLATKIKRTMCGYLMLTTALSVVGIASCMSRYDIVDFLPILGFAAFRLYINLPIIAACLKSDEPKPAATAGAHRGDSQRLEATA